MASSNNNLSAHSFSQGVRDGIPIALGYLAVSFSFGIAAVNKGLSTLTAVLISATNLTSAGQFAGIEIIAAGGLLIELIITQLIINLRYSVMSISLSQKVDKTMSIPHRLLVSFFVTDEVFAVAYSKPGLVGRKYMYGLGSMPILGWVGGTLLGAVSGELLSGDLRTALGLALYAMFIAIVVPPAKQNIAVVITIFISAVMSCIFKYVPVINKTSGGFAVIICGVFSAVLASILFPIKAGEDSE